VAVEFQWVVAISLIVMAVALVVIAVEVGLMRRFGIPLVRPKDFDKRIFESHSHLHLGPAGVAGSVSGYAIFVYRDGRWIIEADLSAPGYEPSPPTLPGSYEGHVLKKESSPAPDH
jgi:hypothetical protein